MTQHVQLTCNHIYVTGRIGRTEVATGLSVILLATAGIMAAGCYVMLQRARKEYKQARASVEDIVLSFNRQLGIESEKLEHVAFKLEALSAKSEVAIRKSDETQKAMPSMETAIASVSEDRDKISTRIDELTKQVSDVIKSQVTLTTKMANVEEHAQQIPVSPEANIDAVIPIKRDRALAPLTETELAVLEMLATEGSKTAPEIKDRVKLSREHTARLMKKLYESGYLERDMLKIPFKYSVKKEMEKLLRKSEGEAA